MSNNITGQRKKYLLLESVSPGEDPDLKICIIKIQSDNENSLTFPLLQELKETLIEISENEKIQLVILTSNSKSCFISETKMSELTHQSSEANSKKNHHGIEWARLGHQITQLLESMPKPTIAAVNGIALGNGTEIAISCDFILASESAIFGHPEISLGLTPSFGATFRLAKSIGLPKAKELIFSGRKINATEALSIGLVNHVFPEKNFINSVIEYCKNINMQCASAIAQVKKLLNDSSESIGFPAKLDAETQIFSRLLNKKTQ